MKNKNPIIIILCLIGLAVVTVTKADSFGWYPHKIDPGYVERLLHGGLDADKTRLDKHFHKYVKQDIDDDNFPYDVQEVRQIYENVLKSGLELDSKDEKYHELQWYVMDVLLASSYFSDVTYSPSRQKAIGKESISPSILGDLIDEKGFGERFRKAYVLADYVNAVYGDSYAPKNKDASCLPDIKFGVCLYSYIILTTDEVEEVKYQIEKVRIRYKGVSKYVAYLDYITEKVLEPVIKNKMNLVLYGQE